MDEHPQVHSLDRRAARRAGSMRVDLVELGGLAFDRATFPPGWRWSTAVGARSCPERHLGYLVSGRMRFVMESGDELEAGSGDVYLIPPGHDAWVVGDEPCVALDVRPL
jgi:mannose-6-phosphate isomerase-like protein (cupin superfamily)